MHSIGTLRENSLHAALKDWYARPGDWLEALVEGYYVDLVRDGAAPGGLLIEIQTRHFGAVKAKLIALSASHAVRLVYPIAREKWIVKVGEDGVTPISRRRSPKRGQWADLFGELVFLPRLLAHPNIMLHVLLTCEEEVRCPQGAVILPRRKARRWRGDGWAPLDRRLLAVLEERLIEQPEQLLELLPDGLPAPFTTRELAGTLGRPLRLAQQMIYCLRELRLVEEAGRRGRAKAYRRKG
jgi:hypothetical protein